jgi:hypothetical protein
MEEKKDARYIAFSESGSNVIITVVVALFYSVTREDTPFLFWANAS